MVYALKPSVGEHSSSFIGIQLAYGFDLFNLIGFIISLMAFGGTLWVFDEAQALADAPRHGLLLLLPNLVMPTLSIFILCELLKYMQRLPLWWVVFFLGILLFASLVIVEYRELGNQKEQGSVIESIWIIALAHAFFFILCITLKGALLRLHLFWPLLFMSAMFVSYRTLYLRNKGKFQMFWVFLSGICVTELGIALYYLFINPIQYALILLAFLYSLNSVIEILGNTNASKIRWVEPVVMSFVLLSIALLIAVV